jgi:hypothetical protein
MISVSNFKFINSLFPSAIIITMRSLTKFFKSKKADADYTPLFVTEFNKVQLGLKERLNEAKEDEEEMKKEMERDMPHGHKYDENEENIHILQKENIPAPVVEVDPLVGKVDAVLATDWRPLAIALGVAATCQIIGMLEVLLIVCVATAVLWAMPQWWEVLLRFTLKDILQGAHVQGPGGVEVNPPQMNPPQMQVQENVT